MLNRMELLEPAHPHLSIRQQCALLELNRSSIYYVPKKQEQNSDTLTLLRVVDEIFTRYPFFGTRQMVAYLWLHHGLSVTRTRMRHLYQLLAIEAIYPKPNLSASHPEHKIYPYLLRNVVITRPNHVWSSDITYLRLSKGFAYLTAIIDWYSRYVFDWQLSISLEADFCVSTLQRALSRSRCDIFNTDQGSQFTSTDFTQVLKERGIAISMDGKGRALDNVFVERLWRSVKQECVYLREWQSVAEIRQGIGEYFKFYNNERPHQSLNGKTPSQVYFSLVN